MKGKGANVLSTGDLAVKFALGTLISKLYSCLPH